MAELQYTALIDDANLQAYYRMESGALTTDNSGNSKTLTNNNTVGEGTGKFGGAADFSATNSDKYLDIADDLGITGGAISISCWVKLNAEIGSGTWDFVSQSDAGTFTIYTIRYDYNGGTRRIGFVRNKNNVATEVVWLNTTMGTSNWYNLVLTYNGTNMTGYIDASAGTPTAMSGNGNTAGADAISIGASMGWDAGGTKLFYASALIDDVAIFNRALTETEVQSLYGSGLQVYYRLEADGQDDSPNGYDLTPAGYTVDVLVSGTASTDSLDAGNPPANAVDGDTGTRWVALAGAGLPHWWKYDLGVGVSKQVEKLRIYQDVTGPLDDFVLAGSNNDSDWTTVYTGNGTNGGGWQDFTFSNANSYRYYKLTVSSKFGLETWVAAFEIEMMEVSLPSYVAGKFGNGADFELSSSQYLSIAAGSEVNIDITGSQSWGCWIKPESLTQQGHIMGYSDVGLTNFKGFYFDSSDYTPRFALTGLTTTLNIKSSTGTISTGTWYFLCGVYDSANSKLKIFVNGTKTEATASGSAVLSAGEFCIGRWGAYTTLNFDGIIDDAFIFNRALTDTEVAILYNDPTATANKLKFYRRNRIPGDITGT